MDADALLSQQSSHKSKGRPVLRRGPQRPFAPSSSKKKKALFFVFLCGDPSPNPCLPLSFNT